MPVTPTRCQIVLLVIGLVCIVLAAISTPLFSYEVSKNVMLSPGSRTYEQWREPTIPIYMQFYMFHLENPEEVLRGGKPSVSQRGPYTYQEHRKKVNISHHNNDTVTYRQIKTYHFVKNMSVGPDTDVIRTVNIPLVTLANFVKWNGDLWKLLSKLASRTQSVFIYKTVREMAFGYHDPMLALGMIFDPERFYTSLVGVLAGKNNTDDGVYTIYTGEKDISKLGVITRYNGSSTLSFWTSDAANMINGSDGTVVAPFTKQSEKLYMFSTDICRSVYGVFSTKVTSKHGIPGYRYSSPPGVTANATENPDNAGFCTPSGHCMGSGVINLTVCQQLDHFQVPIVASFPHFYLADEKYVNAVNGMRPDASQHSTYVDVEPESGIVLEIAKRLQINLYIEKSSAVKDLSNISAMVYPICWVNESAQIDEQLTDQIHGEILLPLKIITITHYVLYGLGASLSATAIVLFVWRAKRQGQGMDRGSEEEEEGDQSNERQPLLT